jgi:predicted AAA+ superfamily ATPase
MQHFNQSRKSIVWLSVVRRVGKTFLCQTILGIEYFDCELPRVRRQMESPEEFLSKFKNKKIGIKQKGQASKFNRL